jgi:membrane-bound lytic murein transglycosylase F
MIPGKTYKHILDLLLLFLVALIFYSCGEGSKSSKLEEPHLSDLERIRQSGILKVAVDYNSTSYFVYRGKPMGYQYDLIQALCKDLEVRPEFTISTNIDETFEGLLTGTYDLAAKNLTVTRLNRQDVAFTKPLKQTRQVIVQRKPVKSAPDSLYLKTIPQLANKTVHVQQRKTYLHRLLQLSGEIGQPIHVVQDSVNGVEQLIAMVSNGDINYTVCDENVAILNRSYYPNIDVGLIISYPQNIAWAVRKGSNDLKAYLDNWIEAFKKTDQYRQIYFQYFVMARTSGRINSEYHSIAGGRISEYDELVKEIAAKHGWDWRLISSIIYHESRFKNDAESWGGAVGLMQLMPATAEALGVIDINEPRQNIEGGVLLLNWLDEQLKAALPDSSERVKFVLASYNIGLGHVKDAQRLAKKYGKDSHIWENNVDYFLKNKSAEKYIEDPAVKWGYARGEEAYNFVYRVIGNYEHYRNLIPE